MTVADIARRADVSTPAIYNHFRGKSELIVEACRVALDGMEPPAPRSPVDPRATVRRYLSDDFAEARTLQIELHLAARRHADVADLLAAWHAEHTQSWLDAGIGIDTVKAWYLLLLGISHVDALTTVDASPDEILQRILPLVDALFPDH